MLIKFDNDAYMDIDSITAIVGDYSSKKPEEWNTVVVLNGGSLEVKGQSGKNISDAYMWKNGYMVTDMVPTSSTYRKDITQPK